MPKMHVHKSIEINAPAEKVFKIINDFNHWRAWSPWLIMEPEANVTVADDGKSYEWDGKKIGSGKMHITGEEENIKLNMDLTFLKPWKSHAKVWFDLNETNGGNSTKLTWLMDSSIPFFLFWMTKSMTAFIGMDYERGLAMLKDYIETGKVSSTLDLKGLSSYKGCKYIGIKRSCSLNELPTTMSKDFEKLGNWIKENEDVVADVPFSIYHKFDMVKRSAEYTSGIPVKKIPGNLEPEFTSGSIPETQVYSITHTGPYKHLGNAWSAGYNLIQNKVFKSNKKIPPFEVYPSDPATTPENELITTIHFPVK